MYTSRGDVFSAARDTISCSRIIVTERSDASDAVPRVRHPGFAFTMIDGGKDTIAGLLGRTLDALSIRRDQRQVLLDSPAVVPDADRFELQPFAT